MNRPAELSAIGFGFVTAILPAMMDLPEEEKNEN